ncbi:MAG: histidine phosphatase family protein [Dehalococcoidia bacterium]|nr:histidine phosphatase family protein [Dehalococcoidia bacterium]
MEPNESLRLLLVRHGNIDGAVALGAETPLSLRGQAQADWLGRNLGGEGVTTLLTSPLVRARETAERLAGALGLEPTSEAALAEFELGFEGVSSYAEVQQARPDLAIWHPEHRGTRESLADFQTRVTAFITAVTLRANAGDTVVMVTHAGVIDAALRWAWGLTSRNVWLAEVRAPHASVTEIEHWPRGRHAEGAPRYSVVKRIGDTSAQPGELHSE